MDHAAIHRYRNNAKAIPLGNKAWQEAYERHAIDLSVTNVGDDRFESLDDHNRFVNLCSCSYLGLHLHPWVLEGAIEALQRERNFSMAISRVRIRCHLVDQLEAGLRTICRARAIVTLSASTATAGVLPLIASGHLMDDGEPRVMVFDKFCHFSMNLIKPICADETTVLTSPHNDLDYVEDACKKYPRVAYVADGAYSMGGATMLDGLLELQDRYGLFLYFDDSHSLSVWGERGEGFVRSQLGDELNPLTVVVASLGKGFGATGGVIMLGPVKHEPVLLRFGGPIAWQQSQNVPTLGASIGALRVHNTPQLGELQQKLLANVTLFDEQLPGPDKGNGLPIRLIQTGDEEAATEMSAQILERGFYTSAVFFPIVEKGKAGLRVMLRANNRPEDILEFCNIVREVVLREPVHVE
jgi:7-keto-8-aminopelargonate synthetase-like enzyme